MREMLTDLLKHLNQVCPTFVHVPERAPYPYVTLELEHSLHGYPHGPRIFVVRVKIWSQYKGTLEILKLAKEVEESLDLYNLKSFDLSLKIIESSLVLLSDEETRLHTFRLKIRLKGNPQ